MIGGSGDYVRLCSLATGGMAEVELVVRREGSFTRIYAMKRLLSHLCADPQVRAMFLDEARYAGLIRHANVVSVLDIGEDDRGPFLVMDFVEGVPLHELMQAELASLTPLRIGLALRIVAQVAEGLHAAHELCDPSGTALGLVHRDVSPQNVLVGYDGVVRVTDFGIAKALGQSSKTATGVLKGKLGYMSPEQLRFEEPSRQSDLFALGVVLYELLAGRRLYQGDRGFDGPRRILAEPPPDITDDRPETPPGVVELLFELLAKDPAQRPATAREVAGRLEAELAELSVREGPAALTSYMERAFGAKRRMRAEELSRRLAEIEAGTSPAWSTTPARPVTSSRGGRTARWLGAAVVIGAAGAGALWLVTRPAPAMVGEAPPADPAEAPGASVASAPIPAAAPSAEPDPEPPAEPEPGASTEGDGNTPSTATTAAGKPSSVRAAGVAPPRRPARRTPAPAASAAPAPTASERDFKRFE